MHQHKDRPRPSTHGLQLQRERRRQPVRRRANRRIAVRSRLRILKDTLPQCPLEHDGKVPRQSSIDGRLGEALSGQSDLEWIVRGGELEKFKGGIVDLNCLAGFDRPSRCRSSGAGVVNKSRLVGREAEG